MINGNQFLLECLTAWIKNENAPASLVLQAAQSDGEITLSEVALAPILSYLLISLKLTEKLPAFCLNRLRKYRHFVAANDAVMTKELSCLLEKAAQENIRVLLLKGLALITADVYPEKGLRFLSDMDVFINKEDIPKMEALLDDIGWKITLKEHELHSNHHLPVRLSPNGFPLEVHFAFSRLPLNLDVERIWARASAAKQMPFAFVPSIEDTLLLLTLHVSVSHPDYLMPLHLRFIADFAFIWMFSGGRLDWEYIAETVEKAGISAPFWNTISIARELIDPPGLGDVLKKFNVNKVIDSSFIGMTVSRLRDDRRTGELSWLVALMAEEKNPFKRLLKAVKVVFPPLAYMREAYPKWTGFPWIFLAYPARIFKVLWKFELKNHIMAYRAGKMTRRVRDLGDDHPKRG